MPIKNMSLIKGKVLDIKRATTRTRHFGVLVRANGQSYRLSINALSNDGSEIYYYQCRIKYNKLNRKYLQTLDRLDENLYKYSDRCIISKDPYYRSIQDVLAIDYQHSTLLPPNAEFIPIPLKSNKHRNINTLIESLCASVIAKDNAYIYAYGQMWGPNAPDSKDRYFHFSPQQGLHDIHANQGSPIGNKHYKENGAFQDGCLIFQIPHKEESYRWMGLFLKFSTQIFPTDYSGNPIE